MKSKPLPPRRRVGKREGKERDEREEKEEMEMKGVVAHTGEDKDCYYFEDPSSISIFVTAFRNVFAIHFIQ